jgi:hypothetical protein
VHVTKLILALGAVALGPPGLGAEIEQDVLGRIYISGTLEPGDADRFVSLARSSSDIDVTIDSPGGDVDTAMKIGAEIRRREGRVSTDSCFSACVLIYAGAVQRSSGSGEPVLFNGSTPTLGVHRTYFSDLPAGKTQQEVQSYYDARSTELRDYLRKMNVAPELLSFMQSIDPADTHVLTKSELRRFGLAPFDPVYEERFVAGGAANYRVSTSEFRMRLKRAEDSFNGPASECAHPAGAPTSREVHNAAFQGTSPEVQQRADCALAILAGISLAEYQQRQRDADRLCRQVPVRQRIFCVITFERTGRAPP